MRKTYFNGLHHNVRQLIVLQHKLNLVYNPAITLVQIETKIKCAYQERKRCKELAESLSLEYRTQLALAKEEAGEIKAAAYLRNMNHVEAQRRLFRNIRHTEGKIRGGCTSKVITKIDGIDVELTDKEDIEKLCAKENERKYHQTETGNIESLTQELIQDLGHHGEGPQIQSVLQGIYVPSSNINEETVFGGLQNGPK